MSKSFVLKRLADLKTGTKIEYLGKELIVFSHHKDGFTCCDHVTKGVFFIPSHKDVLVLKS